MTTATRLFRSPWTYLAWLGLIVLQIRHELHPHSHAFSAFWPIFSATTSVLGNVFCISLAFSLGRLVSNALEKSMFALFTLTFTLSLVISVHTLARFRTPMPSLRLVFLIINSLLALVTGIRFFQVLREPPMDGVLSSSPTTTE